MRKFRQWLMISSVLAVFATTSVFAEEESVWKFDDEHRVLKEYTGEDREVTVPDTLMGCSVDGVGSNAFCSSEITSLTFPESVQYLNASVAAHCESLSELKLPESLVMIGDGCFVATALQEVTYRRMYVCLVSTRSVFARNCAALHLKANVRLLEANALSLVRMT